ncbi:hypothetical protein GGTG_01621 [Gaeumannomyces tritici R3-111a-1]|uniref:Aminotransferase class I/classII large domain-containing protein n=1 Tax=Gaeumannomyces tritici (strain R3-111a-1) TaxID=644352 RepID=J3NK39_GAET3|nr:hypothetical protein GGTG_01621 [Gaeumannomyces tritici R3-111a-1]EJT81643.1 hypothetical protein GGTG_01621 [Gaeumannomyces tritici R3-111a-1]
MRRFSRGFLVSNERCAVSTHHPHTFRKSASTSAMVQLKPFAVEQWMDKYEHTPGVLNIAETCAASVSVQDLVELSSEKETGLNPLVTASSRKLTYGAIRGSDALRRNVASLYGAADGDDELPHENVLVTAGAISANFLLFYTLIGPGDHVICVYPTYQQLYSVPESLGAEVSLWKLKESNGYVPDLQELGHLVKTNTKLIVINNPNNPSGAPIPKSVLQGIVGAARKWNIWVLSDEVYRPLFHGLGADEEPPSALSLGYERTIVSGSMSKAYALAGIRIGWLACRNNSLIESLASGRDYTLISVSQLDDSVASFALSPAVRPALIRRNLDLARKNLSLLEAFVDKHSSACSWVKPLAGTTAFVFFSKDDESIDDEKFCIDVLRETGVMFVPGSTCFGNGKDFRGFVRIGYTCETEVLEKALLRLGDYLEKRF